MGRLANVSATEAVSVFMTLGYVVTRQKGSHIILTHESRPTLTVPNHRELAPGLLRALIRQAGFDVELFLSQLRSW